MFICLLRRRNLRSARRSIHLYVHPLQEALPVKEMVARRDHMTPLVALVDGSHAYNAIFAPQIRRHFARIIILLGQKATRDEPAGAPPLLRLEHVNLDADPNAQIKRARRPVKGPAVKHRVRKLWGQPSMYTGVMSRVSVMP